MRITPRTAMREVGTALAVLAIYILTLLLPLHQSAALQRDIAVANGISTASILCGLPAQPEKPGEPAPDASLSFQCPAAGIGKNDFAGILPASIVVLALAVGNEQHALAAAPTTSTPALPDHVGQPRAPPAST